MTQRWAKDFGFKSLRASGLGFLLLGVYLLNVRTRNAQEVLNIAHAVFGVRAQILNLHPKLVI